MAPKLAWGGFANGQIPRANLVDIGGGKLLQANAAESWGRFTAAFRARWGSRLYLASYQDAYRDLAEQQYMWDHRNDGPPHPSKVASPGNSIHGWGRSVDCSGYGQKGSARHNWMVANCANYGWSWAYGKSLNEPWHWDYVGPITTTAGDGHEPIPEPTPTPTPEPERHGKKVTLYLKASSLVNGAQGDGTVYALAGDSPGTDANWIRLAPARANEVAKQIGGSAVSLNDDQWLEFQNKYLQPLRIATPAPAAPAPAEAVEAPVYVITGTLTPEKK